MTKVTVDLKPIAILNELGYPDKARMFLANEIIKVSDPYAPFREGYLKNSAKVEAKGTQVTYNTPYALRLWYGNDFKFKGARVRGAEWVNRAIASNNKQIINVMQRMNDRGDFR